MGSDSDLFYVELRSIPTSFAKCNFKPGQPFNFKFSQVYDPSKFWIVVKFAELEIFQKNLFRYYYLNRSTFKMPQERMQLDMYCVAFTDGNYYRGRIVGLPADIHAQLQVHVFFVDYGLVQMLDQTNIYYMSRRHSEVPQFSIRASLAEVRPRNAQSEWTVDDVAEFLKLVSNKIHAGVVVNIYSKRQVLDIQCKERTDGAIPVHETLIAQKRAQYCDVENKLAKNKRLLEPKYKCAYKFPCHEAIESGKVPVSLSDAEFEVMVSPFSPIVSRYYNERDS